MSCSGTRMGFLSQLKSWDWCTTGVGTRGQVFLTFSSVLLFGIVTLSSISNRRCTSTVLVRFLKPLFSNQNSFRPSATYSLLFLATRNGERGRLPESHKNPLLQQNFVGKFEHFRFKIRDINLFNVPGNE